MTENEHPLKKYSEAEKVAYLSIVASMASVDGNVSDSEIAYLRDLCKKVDIAPKGMGTVISSAEYPDKSLKKKFITDLSKSELRFSLIMDIIFIANADENVTSEEQQEIKLIASLLNVTEDQLKAGERYVNAVLKAQKSGQSPDNFKKVVGDAAASLAATGVPIAAIVVSGSVFGLSAAGVTSGLAALGMGAGMVPGIGTVVALGIGSFLAVRWLFKD